MVLITLHHDAAGRLIGLACSGHAEFSDEEHGGDIVCSAVSALTGFLGLTLADVMGFPEAVSAGDGEFSLSRPATVDEQQQRTLDVLLEGWVRSVKELEENYSGWVKVEESSPD